MPAQNGILASTQEKTRASAVTLTEMMLFEQNRSWEWLSRLDGDRKAHIMTVARKSVPDQLTAFFGRAQATRNETIRVVQEV